MVKSKKILVHTVLASLFVGLIAPIPAQAADQVFDLTKDGNPTTLNDIEDPLMSINFSGYTLNEDDYSYRMIVFDKFNGETKEFQTCDSYEDCSFYVRAASGYIEPGLHQYYAVLDRADNNYGDFRVDNVQTPEDLDNPVYTSTTLNTIMERPTISLSSNTGSFTTNVFDENGANYPELFLKVPKNPIADDYLYYTFDITNNKLVSSESKYDSTMSIFVDEKLNNDAVVYQTFQAKSSNLNQVKKVEDLIDIKETTNQITLIRKPWVVFGGEEFLDGFEVSFVTGGGNKTYYFSDPATGAIIYEDNFPLTSHLYVPYQPGIVVTVADPPKKGSPITNISQLTGVLANNQGLVDSVAQTGLESKEQVAGGSNPSENCAQTCGGDPINFYTGEFFENATDLTMAGSGLSPNAGRSFSTQRKDELGSMGYGWRSNYDMQIKSATTSSLATSDTIKIIQENGSASFFKKNPDGTYSGGDKVNAKLSKNPSGKYVFVRDMKTTFTFSSQGKLEKIEDLNGNSLTMTYTGTALTGVTDNHGNTLTYTYNAENLISKVTANNGRSVTYTYTTKRITKALNENGIALDYTYDSSRRVKTLKDALGGITENFYDANHRVTRQDDPYDKQLRFSYASTEGLDQTTTVTYPNGRIVVETYQNGALTRKVENPDTALEKKWYYNYDINNNLLSSVTPDGVHTDSTYDSRGNMLTHRNALGGLSTFTYDGLNNVLTAKNPLGKTISNTYDARGNLTSTTDPLGGKTTYTWSATGNLETIVNPLGNATNADPDDYKTVLNYTAKGLVDETIDSIGNSTSTEYDALGRSISSTLPKGNETSSIVDDYTIKTGYNALDLPNKVTDQKGNVTEITYDNAGNILTAKDEKGNTTTMTYGYMNRLLTLSNQDGTTTYTYNTVGQVLTAKDAKNNVTTYAYNKSGDLTKVTDPKLNVTTPTYDKMGRVVTSKDPRGAITKFYYDAAGNQTAVEDAQGKTSGTVYNKNSQVIRSYDKEGKVTAYTYNDNGLLIKTTMPDNSTLTVEYDSVGNQTKRTNGEGNHETWEYDVLGRMISYTDQEGKTEQYTYDSHSNVVSVTLENGSIIENEYDEKDLPVFVDYEGSNKDTEFTYDSRGLITKEKVGAKETNTTYDHAKRILNRGGVSYEYDELGNQKKITYPSGRILNYTYDANQNLTNVSGAGIGNIAYSYDKRNLLTSTTLPNGVIEARTQDSLARTTKVSIANATHELHAVEKTYTPNSNLATSKYGIGTGVQNETYEHDNLNRTTNVNSTITNGTGANAYNKAGHMTSFEGKSVISDAVGKPLSIGNTDFTYDNLGQRISQKTSPVTSPDKEFAWNVDGTLDQESSATSTVNYGYSANGLLDNRLVGSVGRGFVWDESEVNALLLSDGDYEYVYGVNRVPVAQVELATGSVEYLHADVTGSVIAVTTDTGVLAGTTNYGAYGKRLGSAISRFGYAGEWTDPDTGNLYLRARWYDPNTGHFLSKDPLYQTTSEAYGYAGGNPLTRTDPSGLFWGIPSPTEAFNELITKPISNKIDQVQGQISNTVESIKQGVGNAVNATVNATKEAATYLYENSGTISSVLGAAALVTSVIPVVQGISPVLAGGSLLFGAVSLKRNIGMCLGDDTSKCSKRDIAFDFIGVATGGTSAGLRIAGKLFKNPYVTGLPGNNGIMDFTGGMNSLVSLGTTIGISSKPDDLSMYSNMPTDKKYKEGNDCG